jgi:hypothetical protein
MISNSAILITDGIGRLIDFFDRDLFTFVVNGQGFRVSVIEALLLSPHVGNALNQDNTTRHFIIEDCRIESASFHSILSLFRNEQIFMKTSFRKTQIIL